MKTNKYHRTELSKNCRTTFKGVMCLYEYKKKKEWENYFKVIMAKMFPKLMTDTTLQNQEAQRTSKRITVKEILKLYSNIRKQRQIGHLGKSQRGETSCSTSDISQKPCKQESSGVESI